MQNIFLITIFICLFLIVIIKGQYFQYYNNIHNGDDINGNYLLKADRSDYYLSSARDPRENRGPVLFPQSPSASPETSGVIVGASGYGFVPGNQDSKDVRYSFLSR